MGMSRTPLLMELHWCEIAETAVQPAVVVMVMIALADHLGFQEAGEAFLVQTLARNRLWNASANGFCQGEPGSM